MVNYKTLREWMSATCAAEHSILAKLAKTSRGHLYQLAGGHRVASAQLAGRIEQASAAMRVADKKLPLVGRASMCAACAKCPHYAKHGGKAK